MISITDGKQRSLKKVTFSNRPGNHRILKKKKKKKKKERKKKKEKNAQPTSTSAFQKGTSIDPVPWNILMQRQYPGYFYFLEKCQRYLHEGRPDQISPWDIFLS